MVADTLIGRGAFVTCQIIHDDDVAAVESGCQLGFHIDLKDLLVHGGIDDPWRGQAMTSQGGNEGLGLPMAEGDVIIKPLTDGRPAVALGQFGVCRGFIKKNKAVKRTTHARLAPVDPQRASRPDISALALTGDQRFFYG